VQFDDSQLNTARKEFITRARPVEDINFHFDLDSAVLPPKQEQSVFAASSALTELLDFAQRQKIPVKIEVVGSYRRFGNRAPQRAAW
jgi:hypothetical protein